MGWKIEVGGAAFHEEDVLAAHVSVVAELLDTDSWEVLDPIGSPRLLVVWSALAASVIAEKSMDETLIWAQAQPIVALIEGYTAEAPAAAPPPPPAPPAEAPETSADRKPKRSSSVTVDERRAGWVNQMATRQNGS